MPVYWTNVNIAVRSDIMNTRTGKRSLKYHITGVSIHILSDLVHLRAFGQVRVCA